MRVNAIKSSW